MAYRVPPILPVPDRFKPAISAAVRHKALQHQDELTGLLAWTQTLWPPINLDIIVEIGSHQGGTLACWAEVARDLVVGIDLPLGAGGPTEWGGIDDEALLVRDETLRAAYPHLRTIIGNSQEQSTVDQLRRVLNGRKIDLLFIDGDHTAKGVATDYLFYSPLVRPGGVIAFHDINPCIRAAQQNFAVPDFFAGLPGPKFGFSVGYEWGGIGAIVQPWPKVL